MIINNYTSADQKELCRLPRNHFLHPLPTPENRTPWNRTTIDLQPTKHPPSYRRTYDLRKIAARESDLGPHPTRCLTTSTEAHPMSKDQGTKSNYRTCYALIRS